MKWISIKYCDIPVWLRAGEFYRSLCADEPDSIVDIPADCFKENYNWTTEDDLNDFYQLVRVTLFWLLDEIPVGVLNFCYLYDADVWQNAVCSVPGAEESKILAPLLGLYPLVSKGNIPLEEIINTGKLELIIHAANMLEDKSLATGFAARLGNLRVLKHLHEQGFEWHSETCCAASQYGNLDCLQYAYSNGCAWGVKVFEFAASGGSLHIMQYAHQEGLNEWSPQVCSYAALAGHLQCIKFARESGCPWTSDAVFAAAQNGHVNCLQYMLERECPVHEDACQIAVRGNHLSCLRLLHQYAAPWSVNTSSFAAMNSDVSCLQYLHEHGCPWDRWTTRKAAEAGRVAILRYAMEQNCPCDPDLLRYTASSGRIECLKYLVEDQMLLMDENVFMAALLNGHFHCLQYLIDQGCPYIRASYRSYSPVPALDKPEFTMCVRYAVERGWTLNYALCERISTRNQPLATYLRSEGLFVEYEEEDEEWIVTSTTATNHAQYINRDWESRRRRQYNLLRDWLYNRQGNNSSLNIDMFWDL